MMRSRLLAGILAFLCIGAVAAARGIDGPTLADFNALEQRVAALEEEVFSVPEPEPSPTHSHHPSPEPSPDAPSPGPGSEIDRVLSGQIAGATVPAGETWKIEGLVESSANVVVLGTLVMRPGATLRFVGVNETAFVGGGMDPVASDVGLWVMGAGKLDIQGTPKMPWNRTGTDPTWRPTDELVVTPTSAGEWLPEHFRAFRMGSPVPTAFGYPAEVLNLSRDVVIEGTRSGRSHIFIRSTTPQTIRHAVIRYMGPHKHGQKVLGRWALHFHHSGDGSRGSVVEGVVVRDTGSHAFVPHASNGITFRGNIAYDVFETPYWWDLEVAADDSNDIVWESNVAAMVRGPSSEHRLTGFLMGRGTGLVARGNVATGVLGGADNSGFLWDQSGSGIWSFEDNVAHNNKGNGIFIWTNRGQDFITKFTAYRNGQYGIDHGAYTNSFQLRDVALRGNAWGALNLHALSRSDVQLTFDRVSFGGWIVSRQHILPGSPSMPLLFRDCTDLVGVQIDDGLGEGSILDFVRCGVEPTNFQISKLGPGARIRVQRADGTAFQITSAGVQAIPAFA